MRAGLIGLGALFGVFTAVADDIEPLADCGTACILEVIWEKVEHLEPKKRDRIEVIFLETVAAANMPELNAIWERRSGRPVKAAEPYSDYALEKVSKFLDAQGWGAFFRYAETRTRPFNSGRPEMMAAAAEHLADEATAERIYDVMETYASREHGEFAFERNSFGHALAEAAMKRCDIEGFERALRFTDAPNNIRYAFWRTRMSGGLADIKERIEVDFDESDTALLRQSLDGLSDVLRLEPCLGDIRIVPAR